MDNKIFHNEAALATMFALLGATVGRLDRWQNGETNALVELVPEHTDEALPLVEQTASPVGEPDFA